MRNRDLSIQIILCIELPSLIKPRTNFVIWLQNSNFNFVFIEIDTLTNNKKPVKIARLNIFVQ
jgi:hypothetical protein